MRARSLVASTVLVGLAGCASCDSVPGDAVLDCNQQPIAIGGVKTDILFVVDDSGSMATHQANLATNFKAFIQNLAASPVKNDFQIGITTSSVDINDPSNATTPWKVLTSFPSPLSGCTGTGNRGHPYPAGALVYTDPSSVQSTTAPGRILTAALDPATLVSAFIQNVHVGTCGSGKEQPLRAMKLALSEPLLSGANAGLLRPGARLAVVIVSDDNDCSDAGWESGGTHYGSVPSSSTGGGGWSAEEPNCGTYAENVNDFVSFLQTAIGGEVRDTVVAVIGSFALPPATPGPDQCTLQVGGGQAEAAAPRNWAFVTGLGANGISTSICSSSFHDTLQTLADMLVPQTFPLEGAPADWRMLTVARVRGGLVKGCTLALDGTPGAATAAAFYKPPQGGEPAYITMNSGCTLAAGDAVQIRMVCAH
jgi:hypothetical protein